MAEKKKKPYEIGELDQYLLGQGNHYEVYKKLGAHLVQNGRRKGALESHSMWILQHALPYFIKSFLQIIFGCLIRQRII